MASLSSCAERTSDNEGCCLSQISCKHAASFYHLGVLRPKILIPWGGSSMRPRSRTRGGWHALRYSEGRDEAPLTSPLAADLKPAYPACMRIIDPQTEG